MRRTNAPFRLLRTSLIGATVLGLAAGAHVLAGGSLPGPGPMAALLALHVLVATAVTAFHLALPVMAALLGASQPVLHHAFDAFSATLPALSVPPGMHHHGLSAAEQAAVVQAAGAMGTGMGHAAAFPGWMLPAHMAATLVTALLLSQGENALWTLAGWLRPLRRPAAVVRPLPARQASPPAAPAPLPRLPWRNLRPNTHRGPPAAAAPA